MNRKLLFGKSARSDVITGSVLQYFKRPSFAFTFEGAGSAVKSKKVSYRYPDIMVICGEPNFIDNPTVVVEILSPSTALEDRNAKLDEYHVLSSVQGY